MTHLVDPRHGGLEISTRRRSPAKAREEERGPSEERRVRYFCTSAKKSSVLSTVPSLPFGRCRVTSSRGAKSVAPRQVTARNTTVRCGHLSLSRVAS